MSFLRLADRATLERAGIRRSGDADFDRALSGVVTSAALAHDAGGRSVSVSRRKAWYAAEGRYQGRGFTYANVTEAVEHAATAGLIVETRAKPGSHLRCRGEEFGVQSSILATPALVEAFADATYTHTLPVEAMVRMRDGDGETCALPTTRAARRIVGEMEIVNEIQAHTHFDLVHPDVERTRAHLIVPTAKGNRIAVLASPDCQLVRIFGRGRLDKHGRLYGSWQGLPKAMRAAMTINGEAVAEPDFAFNHAHMLYLMAGVPLVGDPYETGTHDRDDGKLAFNTLVNAKTVHGAVSSLFRREWDDGIVRTHAYCTSLVEAVLARNEPVRHLLGRDLGVDLMHLDSRVAIEVVKECGRAGIPVAPVHDSIVCPGRHACKVAEIMGAAGARVCGALNPSPVKINGRLVPQVSPRAPALPPSPSSSPVSVPLPSTVGSVPPLPSCDATREWATSTLIPSQAAERDRLIRMVRSPSPGNDPLAGWNDEAVFMLDHIRRHPGAAASWLTHIKDSYVSIMGEALDPATVDPRKLRRRRTLSSPKPRRAAMRPVNRPVPVRLPPTVRTKLQPMPTPVSEDLDRFVRQVMDAFPGAVVDIRPAGVGDRRGLVGGGRATYPSGAS